MALAAKYQAHQQFIAIASDTSAALTNLAKAYGVEHELEFAFESAAGNIVDDITRLVILMIEKKAGRS